MREARAERGRGSALRWILLAAVAVALVVAARVLPVGEWLRAFEGWVARQGAWGGVLYGVVYVVAGWSCHWSMMATPSTNTRTPSSARAVN